MSKPALLAFSVLLAAGVDIEHAPPPLEGVRGTDSHLSRRDNGGWSVLDRICGVGGGAAPGYITCEHPPTPKDGDGRD